MTLSPVTKPVKFGDGSVGTGWFASQDNGTTDYPLVASADASGNVINPAQEGTDAAGVTPMPSGVGIRGWLSSQYAVLTTIGTKLGGLLKVTLQDANGNTIAPALDGTDATSVAPLTGASGIRGWLSSIYAKLPTLSQDTTSQSILTAIGTLNTDLLALQTTQTSTNTLLNALIAKTIGIVMPTSSGYTLSGTGPGAPILLANYVPGLIPSVNVHLSPNAVLAYQVEFTNDATPTPNGAWSAFPGLSNGSAGLSADADGTVGAMISAVRLNIISLTSGTATIGVNHN